MDFSVQLEEVAVDPFDATATMFHVVVKLGTHIVMSEVYYNAKRHQGTDNFVHNADVALQRIEEKFISRFIALLDYGVTE